ncbi:MAG: nuclear transport factor 2 family protein, partial [Saprospiraceae bacterium]|nr:nuclear transport factor 2 family protein [Saprospiraceae bacterium]
MEAKENEGMMESVKAEVLLITKNFWQALADRDIEKRFLQCADTITFIGTGVDEKASGKAEYYAINKKGVEQYPEKFKLEILWERASVMDDVGWVESETEWAQMINGKEEKTLIRNSILLKKIGDQWWIMHVHGSVPDFRLSGQNYITNAETIKINRELESEVYQRTKELEKKNKELEIESSLEKVRTVAMGMRKPDDMLLVCKIISEQLQMLQINDIRNVQTAIIDEQGGKHYMNYQYFTQYAEGTIEEVEIAKHPAVVDMIRNMQQSTDAFFRHSFEGVELEKWIQYRKEDHQFSDPILEASSAVHFYFYSIGEGGLGISAYTPLSENDLSIFHRFRNVFSLAYQRFRDIEKAEAQAREALIEASLERVRARSMAMQRSEELVEASNVLFSELHKLGIEPIRTGVGTVDIEKESVVVWSSQLVEHNEIKILGEVPRHTHPFFDGYYTAWLNKEPWFTYTMKGDTLRSYYQGMSSILSYPSKTEFNPEETFSIFFFQEGSLNVITHTPLMEEECRLMQRFANVFGLIYRRFLDLKLAEAQAREGQIELALERVRARTMAMQRSDELSETAHLLFQQLKALGESPLQITIGIVHEEDRYIEFRVTDWAGGGLQINRGFNASIDEPTLVHKMFIAWKEQHKSLVVDLSGKELEDWVTYRNAMSGITVSSTDTNGRRVITCAFFSRGHISFSSPEPRPKETIQLLERFAGVFDQTYTRFLDLQRSEAQAKEARIEAALERVRSRTMGMQKSEELKEVIQVVYDQFVHLNIKVEHTGFVMDYKTRDDHHIWIADKVASPAELTIPYFDAVYYNQFNEAKTKGLDFFATLLTFEQKNKFYQDLFKYVPGLPE